MATAPVAQCPQASPYIVFEQLPHGCFALEVTDYDSEPLIHRGEFVVIDPNDCEPVFGSLFLRRYNSVPDLAIVEVLVSPFRKPSPGRKSRVMLASHNRPRTIDEQVACLKVGGRMGWADGPFEVEGPLAWYIGSIILGRVIGLYAVGELACEATTRIDARPSPFSNPDEYALVAL